MRANDRKNFVNFNDSVLDNNGGTSIPEQTSQCLLKLIADGNASAFEILYNRYGSLIFAICLRVLKHELDAQDLLSEIFIEVWQKADRFDPCRGSPESFLVTIARSRAIDRMRKIASRARSENCRTVYHDLTTGEYNITLKPLETIVAREERHRVQNALFELKVLHRRMLESTFYDGMTHQQISRRFKLPLGTVKTSIRQALIALRATLQRSD